MNTFFALNGCFFVFYDSIVLLLIYIVYFVCANVLRISVGVSKDFTCGESADLLNSTIQKN